MEQVGYRYRKSEDLGPGTRRIARELVSGVSRLLDDGNVAPEAATHEARKTIKKLRGLLRLVRPVLLDDAMFAEADRTLRKAAKQLARYRDADVVRHTLRALDDAPEESGAPTLIDALSVADEPPGAKVPTRAKAFAEFRVWLGRFLGLVTGWQFLTPSLSGLERGYRSTLDAARGCMHEAIDDPSEERFHEWRKMAKYHGYHIALLAGLDAKRANARASKCDALQDILGRHHDFAVLKKKIKPQVVDQQGRKAFRRLKKRMKVESSKLAAEARALGDELFTLPPAG